MGSDRPRSSDTLHSFTLYGFCDQSSSEIIELIQEGSTIDAEQIILATMEKNDSLSHDFVR